ncbi:MAG: 50S ribosomal protein L13 [Candidatus Niyogibacteria bacterium]|nr:50S ribosomal protein L13 [Candidatus Niyogibacteria bacterium]
MPEHIVKSNEKVSVDVAGLAVGRAASAIAVKLRGKDRATFLRHIARAVTVEVKNADKMKVTLRKRAGKIYTRYTGYPGGLRKERLGDVFAKDPREVLRRAVWGMLPKNKLRRIFIKHLTFA